ncbi:oxygen-dependent tRNA uridine(34) hydroxylase TrhO [Arcanobacterium ihumii]|uniref:oxygen-dependent tRNA uridine(34) hydroxylase TrhO n=1 Tax=Arcanobacterium ihumii TaxID=2138162 RepID=UPI000F51BCFA|nr:rhodanese-related sulfurtransferase [Arcanobacterium ihumii]
MAMPRILLFYKFTPIKDPQAMMLWQKALCQELKLRGRILISEDGINATVGGSLEACKQYAKRFKEYPQFRGTDIKWSEGTGLDSDGYSLDFPKLSVKVRKEIVGFGAPGELKVNRDGVVGGGTHVKPEDLEQLISDNPDLVFFDGRNKIEWEIGRFENAIVPNTHTSHDFISELESGKFDDIKDKPILTYCTGGIRCEILSAMMKNRGFENVYQLDGGIVRYAERFGNEGRWQGSLTVFDKREVIDYDPEARKIGTCHHCGGPANRLHNCNDLQCRTRLVTCENCMDLPAYCEDHAQEEAVGTDSL